MEFMLGLIMRQLSESTKDSNKAPASNRKKAPWSGPIENVSGWACKIAKLIVVYTHTKELLKIPRLEIYKSIL